jgi:hypothetical protein
VNGWPVFIQFCSIIDQIQFFIIIKGILLYLRFQDPIKDLNKKSAHAFKFVDGTYD